MIEIRLLGTFAVLDDGRPVPLRAGRTGEVLARLALAAGRPVPRATLSDDLWEGAPPPTAANKVQGYVSALRKALGPAVIRTAVGGYALGAGVAVDVVDWRAGVVEGLRLADRGDDLAAMAALSLAAERWTTDPLGGLGAAGFLAAERRALEELHLEGAERRAALRLQHGFVSAALVDLGRLVERYPLHEGLLAQLVLGTAMSGRQVDALLLHERARTRLAEEFGLEPGEKLRSAQERVLRGALPAAATAPARTGIRTGLRHLPDRMVGRAVELDLLGALCDDPTVRLVTLTGLGGVGKTRLAQAVVAGRHTTACWIALEGAADEAAGAEAVAEQLGVAVGPGEVLPQVTAAIAALAQPLLLVLDGMDRLAGAGRFVERLLLGDPGLTVLATSRTPLGLAPERRVVVDALPEDAAVGLLRDRLSRDGAIAAADEPVVAEIARRCGGLPLALELAAARARVLPLPALRDRLTESTAVLGGPEGSPVTRAIASSADLLPARAAHTWAAATVFAGGFTADALAAVTGLDLLAVLDDCSRLLDLALLRREDGRLDLPPVVRDHAAGLLAAADRAQLRERHAARFAALAVDADGALAVLAPERANLRVALDAAAPPVAALLALAAPWCASGDGGELIARIDAALLAGTTPRDRLALLLARLRAGGQDAGPEVDRVLADAAATARCVDDEALHRDLAVREARRAHATGGAVRVPDPDPAEVVLAAAADEVAAGRPDDAVQHLLAALSGTHAADRFARARLLAPLAAIRVLEGRVETAGDAERAAIALLAGSTWTREQLTVVLVAAARLAWEGPRVDDAAFLAGVWQAGIAVLGTPPGALERQLRGRALRRIDAAAPGSRLAAERRRGERLVADCGVGPAAEQVLQALLDGRAVRPQRALREVLLSA